MLSTLGGVYRALYIYEKSGPFQIGAKALPTPGRGEVIIKEISVALNPVDWKIQERTEYPAILGYEGAGEIEVVGEDVTAFKKGDKVFHQGYRQNDYATFQEYVLCPAEIVVKLPSNITLDQAASIPIGIGTAAVPFYSQPPLGFGLKAPWDGGRTLFSGQAILIFGGASSVGQYGKSSIQLARLSGFSVIIATASLHNAELLKSLGAMHIIDRGASADSFASTISTLTSLPLMFVYDAVSSAETQQLGYGLLQSGGSIVTVLPSCIQEAEGNGKKILRSFCNLHLPGNRDLGMALAKHLPGLIEAGEIVPNQIEVVPGGLNGVTPGLERLKHNNVSGKKLIVHPRETVTRGLPLPLPV